MAISFSIKSRRATARSMWRRRPATAASGVIGSTSVSDPAAYGGGTYSIDFTAPNTYQVLNAAHAVVASGTYTERTGHSFAGLQVTLSGSRRPEIPSMSRRAPIKASSQPCKISSPPCNSRPRPQRAQAQLNNSINGAINNIDQALAQTQTVQASVGARLNTITTQQSVATSQQTQLQQSISTLQSLDYASAITTLDQQNTTLSAAMQAYTLTQGLSLFKYIS